jgi:hypothetical protein
MFCNSYYDEKLLASWIHGLHFTKFLLLTNWADAENEVIKHKVQEMFVTRMYYTRQIHPAMQSAAARSKLRLRS